MTTPTVLIWDPIRDLDWSYEPERILLQSRGVRLVVPETARATSDQLGTADVVIVSGRFPSGLLAEMPRTVGIICYSVGMDAVNAGAAAEAGITVSNVAGYCTDEVADHAMALLLALQRRLYPFLVSAQAGDWNVYHGSDFLGIRRLRGQTVGILGLGRIGSQVAQRCSAFGMTVIAYDPYVTESTVPGVGMVDLDDLLARSDAVVLCGALTQSSRGLLDADRIGRMRPDAVLVNVARGGLVDEQAVADAVRSGRLAGAALDVRAEEPPGAGDVLVGIPNLLLTQHMAATSQQARDDLHTFAARRAVELLVAAGRLPVEAV
jgi:D-3-phosphoglycerate dehydrogenase